MAISSRFIFKIIASDFANRLRRVAQHARRLFCSAQASCMVGKHIHARLANFRDKIYIAIVTIIIRAAWTEKHQTFCPHSRCQMSKPALATDIQQTVRQNIFRQLQMTAEKMAVSILYRNVTPPHIE